MAEYKREFYLYTPFDVDGMEKHLEEMAEKGWALNSWGTYFFRYRKIEPKKLHYCVVHRPKASYFQTPSNEYQVEYESYLAEGGWTRVVEYGKVYIYVSEEENPTPIETDEMLRLENIHQACKRMILLPNVVLMFALLLNGSLQSPWNSPVDFYSDSLTMCAFFMAMVAVVALMINILLYYRWYRRCKKEQRIVSTLRSGKRYRRLSAIWLVVVIVLLLFLLFADTSLPFGAILIYTGLLFLLAAGYRRVIRRLRERFSKGVTMIISVTGLTVLVVALLTGLMMYFFLSEEARVNREEIPLTIQDISEKTIPSQEVHVESRIQSGTFLMDRLEVWTEWDGEDYISLDYVVMNFKHDLPKQRIIDYYLENTELTGPYREVKNPDWTADSVYVASEEGYYLLVYQDALIYLDYTGEIDGRMAKTIEQKLLGIS